LKLPELKAMSPEQADQIKARIPQVGQNPGSGRVDRPPDPLEWGWSAYRSAISPLA
jgi:hypothetical protein